MRDVFFERAARVSAASRWLVAQSQELQDRHQALMRRALRTDDGLVVAISEARESVAKCRGARDGTGADEAGR